VPREVDVDQKRASLIAATWRVVREVGFAGATLRRIASEAGCTTGALTKYFRSREVLFLEAIRVANRAARASLQAAAQSSAHPLKRLEAVLLAALPLDAARLGDWQTRLSFFTYTLNNQALRAENARGFAAWRDFLEAQLAPVPQPARRHEAEALTSLIDGLGMRLALRSDTAADVDIAVATVRHHLRELARRQPALRSESVQAKRPAQSAKR
jgi:AcrR family transcriptional regulator